MVFDLTEQTCLLPQLAGINANSGINGYFSRADYIEILQHAIKHFVEVISFDMPGTLEQQSLQWRHVLIVYGIK